MWRRLTQWFRSTPTIEFRTSVEGLEEFYPILPAKHVPFPWVEDSRKHAEKVKPSYGNIPQGGAHKCSGIHQLQSFGWVLTTWHDLYIETNGDGKTFSANFPAVINAKTVPVHPVGHFEPELYGGLPTVKFAAPTLQTIIKIHTPWTFLAPRGWGLLMLPMSYSSETRFTCATGVLNPKMTRSLNPVLYWHVLKGKTVIKAGTPLCYLLPIRVEGFPSMTMRALTDTETRLETFRSLIMDGTWARNYKNLEKLYEYEESQIK